jgi:hypothetical protein
MSGREQAWLAHRLEMTFRRPLYDVLTDLRHNDEPVHAILGIRP